MAVDRPLLTVMASGRNDSYQAVSCRPGYFKSKRQLSLLPAGRNRPIAVFGALEKQPLNATAERPPGGGQSVQQGGQINAVLGRIPLATGLPIDPSTMSPASLRPKF